MMGDPKLHIYGTVISTYSRIVQIVAEEAGVAWDIVPTPALSEENTHPFGKVPVVEIDGLRLIESVAITQYIDNVYNDSALQPDNPVQRAELDKWVAITNNYFFPTAEHGLVMPHIMHRVAGTPLRTDLIERTLPKVAHHLTLVCARVEESSYFAGPDFSLADIFVYCVMRGVQLTPEGGALIDQLLPLRHWMNRIGGRDSVIATRWPGEE